MDRVGLQNDGAFGTVELLTNPKVGAWISTGFYAVDAGKAGELGMGSRRGAKPRA